MQKLNSQDKIALEKIAVKNRKNILRLMKAGRMGHSGELPAVAGGKPFGFIPAAGRVIEQPSASI